MKYSQKDPTENQAIKKTVGKSFLLVLDCLSRDI